MSIEYICTIKNMKKIAFIVLTVLISFNAKAEIESRELLDEIFYGCASDDEDWLTTGELYEYCGCSTNVISKVLSIEDILRLGLELLETDNISEEEAERKAIATLLQNDEVTQGIVKCLGKVFE